uniref:hypothetical protein n=1 Tax=Eubacterium ventriosum TaxID=39496 RepID=UPI001A9A531F
IWCQYVRAVTFSFKGYFFDFLHNMEFTPAYDFISNNFYIKIPSNKFTLTLSDGISSIYYLFFLIENITHFLQKYR